MTSPLAPDEITHLTDPGDTTLRIIEYEDHVTVWLDPDITPCSGLIIGIGDTRQEAIAEAVRVLEWATEQLQGPPAEGFQ